MMHMLKWDCQPQRRSCSWLLSIKAQSLDLEDIHTDNPGLKPRISEAMERVFGKARIEAAQDTGLDLDAFPEACPDTWQDIAARELMP